MRARIAAAALLGIAKDDVRVVAKTGDNGGYHLECFFGGKWRNANDVDATFESFPDWSIDVLAAYLSRALENATIRATNKAMRSRAQAEADAERETELLNAMALLKP